MGKEKVVSSELYNGCTYMSNNGIVRYSTEGVFCDLNGIMRGTAYISDTNDSVYVDLQNERFLDVLGIALTDDLLIIMGFSKDEEERRWRKGRYTLYYSKKGFFTMIMNNIVRINNVHQLQHLLQMCGGEYKINKKDLEYLGYH